MKSIVVSAKLTQLDSVLNNANDQLLQLNFGSARAALEDASKRLNELRNILIEGDDDDEKEKHH